jgi:hypothetical protein
MLCHKEEEPSETSTLFSPCVMRGLEAGGSDPCSGKTILESSPSHFLPPLLHWFSAKMTKVFKHPRCIKQE